MGDALSSTRDTNLWACPYIIRRGGSMKGVLLEEGVVYEGHP